MDTKALELDFETINLLVKKIWNELSAYNENVYHYFVEVRMSNYEPPHKTNIPCPIGDVNNS